MDLNKEIKTLANQEALALETFLRIRLETIPPRLYNKIVLEKRTFWEGSVCIVEWRILLKGEK